jgi:hypothetical protein
MKQSFFGFFFIRKVEESNIAVKSSGKITPRISIKKNSVSCKQDNI